MNIYQDTVTRRLFRDVGLTDEITSLDFKRGDKMPIVVRFVNDGSVVELSADATGKALLKPKGRHSAVPVGGAASWTKAGAGSTTTYTFLMLLNTAAINTLLNVGEADELSYTMLNFEIEYKLTTGEVISSVTVPVALNNDENRDDELTPEELPDAEDWLDARAVRKNAPQTNTSEEREQHYANLGTVAYDNLAAANLALPPGRAYYDRALGYLHITTA